MRVLAIAVLLAVLAAAAPASAEVVRLAIVVGANQGGQGTVRLRYAERDAERFARVLTEVGGVRPENLQLLSAPSAASVLRAFDSADARARTVRSQTHDRVILLFYFSGHADGINIELGSSDRLPFADIRRRIESSPADVRVAFIDSCKSGGITQDKGLTRGPAFDLTLTEQTDAGGAAFVTSSSAGEQAQESSDIGGSYFTHFVLSALRGAADSDGNGRVTLSETYQYAFAKTVAETARTVAGAQHPSYSYKLSGRGDLTLADLRAATAALVFPAGAAATYLVLNNDRRELLAEVARPAGEARRLAVPAGTYLVGRRQGDSFVAARFAVKAGGDTVVAEDRLAPEPIALATLKGGDVDLANALVGGYALVGGALGSLTSSSEIGLGYRRELLPRWHVGSRAALGLAEVSDRGLRYRYRAAVVDLVFLRRFDFAAMRLFVGAGIGGAWARQQLLSGEQQSGFTFRYGAAATLDLPVSQSLALSLSWDIGAGVVRLNGALEQRPHVRAFLGVGYAF
jgi:hypothetical protein